MMKRLLTMTIAMLSVLGVANAQQAARLGRVAYWDLTQEYSSETKATLKADTQWNRTGSGGNYSYRYGMTLINEAVVYNETDLMPNLKFTITDGNRLVFTSSLLQVQKSSGLKIALPELTAGNVVAIKTSCGDSKYLTFENKTLDTDYSATTAPTATTSEQTYTYTVLEGKGGSDYVLIPNQANTSKTLDISFIKIYENATKAEAGTETLYDWTFSTVHSAFSSFDTSKHTWSWSSNGYYPSTSSYTDQVLNVPLVAGNTDNGITELDGLKFTTTDNTKIRIDANSGKTGIVLIKAGETALGLGKVIVPITRTGSKVKVTNSKTVRQWGGTDSDTNGTEATDGYFTASSNPFYFRCYGNNDTRVTAISVLDNFATVDGGTPENGSLAFASTGNEVTKDESGTDVVNGFFCGSTITVTATPDAGYELTSLTGTYYRDVYNTAVKLTITGEGNERTFTMPTTGDVTLTATFSKIKYALTSSAENGTVVMKKDDAEGDVINSGDEVEWGTTVYVSATPTSDAYYFTSLKYGDADLTNGGTFTMPQAATAVTAVYTAKTAPTYTAPTYSALTYTSEAQNLVSAGSTEHGTIKYATSETGDYSTTIPQGTNAGDYTVWYKVEGDATHTDIAATQVENVKINKAAISPSVNITGWTAGESANTPSVEGNTGNGAVTYTYKVKDADDGAYSETVPTEVGEYTIKATIAATTNYEGNTATANFTITAATPTYTISLPTAVKGNSVAASMSEGINENEEITLTVTLATDYKLTELKYNETAIEIQESQTEYTFNMPAANVTITAKYGKVETQDSGEEEVNETISVIDDTHAEVTTVTVSSETTEIAIPASVDGVPVTSIASNAFTAENTANVQSIDLSNTQVALSGDVRSSGVLSAIPENTIIYLPQQSNSATGKNVVVTSDGTNFTCANFEMDGGNSTGKSYSVPKPFTAASAKLSREFPEDVAATVCLPYALTQGQANALGKFYLFKSVSGSTVTMEQVTSGGLESNKPYMFMPNSTTGSNGYVEAANVEVSIANSQTSGETGGDAFTFEGVIADKTFTADEISGGIYGFAAEAAHGASSVGQFVKATSGAYVKAFRAYLVCSTELTGESHPASRGIEGGDALPDTLNVVLVNADGSTTNIGKLELIDTDDNTPRYNLSGQRVDKSYKGIVIINGKKVVIK